MNHRPGRPAARLALTSWLALSLACQSSIIGEPSFGTTEPDATAQDAEDDEPDAVAQPAPDADAAAAPAPDADAVAVAPDADAVAAEPDATDPEDAGVPDADAAPMDAEAGAPDAVASDAGNPGSPRLEANVMFSGHSLLDNPLPDDFALIASSLSKDFDWNQQNIPGSPIRARTRGNDFNCGCWDGYSTGKNRNGTGMDVIQELDNPATLSPGDVYDSLIVCPRNDLLEVIRWENTIGFLRHFHDRLVDGNAQGTTYFYQVWREIDKDDHQRWIDFTREELMAYECVASKVNLTLSPANPDSVHVIPGGLALTHLVEDALAGSIPTITGTTRQRLDAIFSDNVHLQRIGVYFMAAVHFATVFNQSPVGASAPPQVPSAAVSSLQQLAWDVVSTYNHSAARSRNMADCRTSVANDVCPEFQRMRGRADLVQWCGDWSSTTTSWNPFVWPDPNWTALPAP